MHTNIKVGTIVNIITVYNRYIQKIGLAEERYEYYKSIDDKTGMLLAQIELNKERTKLGEFLDFYV